MITKTGKKKAQPFFLYVSPTKKLFSTFPENDLLAKFTPVKDVSRLTRKRFCRSFFFHVPLPHFVSHRWLGKNSKEKGEGCTNTHGKKKRLLTKGVLCFFSQQGLYCCGLGMRRCCSANTGNLEHQWSIQNQTSVCTLSCWSDLLLNTLIPNPQTPNKKNTKQSLKVQIKLPVYRYTFFFVQMKIFLTHKWISQNCNFSSNNYENQNRQEKKKRNPKRGTNSPKKGTNCLQPEKRPFCKVYNSENNNTNSNNLWFCFSHVVRQQF